MTKPSIQYSFVTIEDLANLIDYNEPLMFDTETIGLYGKIRLAQFYQPKFEKVLFVEYPNPFELVSIISKAKVVIHNAHYDITTIQDNLERITTAKNPWMPEQFSCTFLLSRLHFFKEDGFGLDAVLRYLLGYDPYDGNDQQDSDWSAPVLSEAQLVYAATDVFYLQLLYDTVKYMEEDINYQLDMLTTRYCLDFQNNGMPFVAEFLTETYAENLKRIEEIGLTINCNSYKQVRAYINSNMSDDLGLATLSIQGNERAVDVRETRKLTKQNSFLKKYTNLSKDGIIYGKFKCSPRSGRTASEGENLQQIPRKLKKIFGVAVDGPIVMIHSDFSQMQLRLVCAITADTAMETLFRAGKDLHNYVAEMIFGKDFTKEHRQIAKTSNFSLLFGAGILILIAQLISDAGLLLSEEDASKVKKKWLSLWKQVAAWQKQGIRDWKAGRVWETPLGRRYKAKMMTDQLAIQIQGAEAEVAKLAIHYMVPKLRELHPDIKLRDFIHDGYIFTCPNIKEIYEAASKIIADAMLEAWTQMSQNFKIQDLPMPCTASVGWNWKELEDDKHIYIYETVNKPIVQQDGVV